MLSLALALKLHYGRGKLTLMFLKTRIFGAIENSQCITYMLVQDLAEACLHLLLPPPFPALPNSQNQSVTMTYRTRKKQSLEVARNIYVNNNILNAALKEYLKAGSSTFTLHICLWRQI